MSTEQTAYLPDPHPHQEKEYFKKVKHTQSIIKTSSRTTKTSLYTQQLFPLDGSYDGIYVMHHGYAEHSSRYFEYATEVVEKLHVAVFLIDAYGHGHSDGLPGYVDSISLVCDDLIEYIEDIKKNHLKDGMKIFLHGNSMGGLIAIQTCRKKKNLVDGVVLSGALIYPANPPNWLIIQVASLLNYLAPTYPMIEGLKGLNSIAEEHEIFVNCKYNYNGLLRIGTGVALQDSFLELQQHLDDFEYPFIFVQGDTDTACSTEHAKIFYEKSKSKDKQFKLYEKTRHELFFEPKKDEIKNDIWTWVEKRLK